MRDRLHMEQEFELLMREFDNPQDAKKAEAARKAAAAAKAAAAKKAAEKKAKIAKLQTEAVRIANELRPFFVTTFSRPIKGTNITYGPAVGGAVRVLVVSDDDFPAARKAEAKKLADSIPRKALKFAPEAIQRMLVQYYNALGQRLPARLSNVDERTRLTADEEGAAFGWAKTQTMLAAEKEGKDVGGFYSSISKLIVIPESSVFAGTLAHEMVHAYAEQGWEDFIYLMQVRRMKETDRLNEGMTTRLAGEVALAWWNRQPSGTLAPDTGSGYGKDYTEKADRFVKDLGREIAYTAYFGGFINFTDNDAPENTLQIGQSSPKAWRWPWR